MGQVNPLVALKGYGKYIQQQKNAQQKVSFFDTTLKWSFNHLGMCTLKQPRCNFDHVKSKIFHFE